MSLRGSHQTLPANEPLSVPQIKADRHETNHDASKDIDALQKETSEAMAKDHEHSKK